MPASLANARTPYGTQRFYPPGKHPAIAWLHPILERLQELNDMTTSGLFGKPAPTEEAISWIEDMLDGFEAGENRAKLAYIERMTP